MKHAVMGHAAKKMICVRAAYVFAEEEIAVGDGMAKTNGFCLLIPAILDVIVHILTLHLHRLIPVTKAL